jgi:radical SAM superfamily enzyme YgiQ (UPF0313 family)
MRVLLVVPTFNYSSAYPAYLSNTDFPIGFPYLAAALKHAGHDVRGLNPNNDPGYSSARDMLEAKLKSALATHAPQLVGIGGLCTDYKFLRDAIAIIRSSAPNVPIVCGGGIITNDAQFAFPMLRPDYCVIGEGEEVLVQLVEALEKKDKNLETVPNIGYWKEGHPCFTRQDFNYGDLDQRAYPDYETFGMTEMIQNFTMAARQQYRYSRPNPRPMPLITARSCPFKCTFCVHQLGIRYRARSIESVIAEIIYLYEKYRFNILLILDELFANNKKRFHDFCMALIAVRAKYGMEFDWQFQTHASADLGLAELALAKQAGCTYFSYGIESASPRVLQSMNKKTRPEQVSQAIRLADEAQVGFGGNFIFGDIAETPETFFETMEFIFKHCLDIHVNFGIVCPYPGSKLFEHCIKHGIIRDRQVYYENIDRYIINMTTMPTEFWPPWIVQFCRIINQLTFVQATTAFRYENEPVEQDHPMNAGGVYTWRITALCPHCHQEVMYRERLHLGFIEKNLAFFITGCPRCHKRLRVNVRADAGKRLEGHTFLDLKLFCDGRGEQPEVLKERIYQAYKEHVVALIKKKNSSNAQNPNTNVGSLQNWSRNPKKMTAAMNEQNYNI